MHYARVRHGVVRQNHHEGDSGEHRGKTAGQAHKGTSSAVRLRGGA
ncbi:hypothetical protein ACIOHS_28020 [Streptomyces sp. NPDC088253]